MVGSGTFAAYKGRTRLVAYAAGGLFGELAVLYGCRRGATVLCEQAGSLWALDRATFKAILKESYAASAEAAGSYLKTIPALSGLSDEQRARVAPFLKPEKYADGEYVLRYGEVGVKLYIIKVTRQRQAAVLSARALRAAFVPSSSSSSFSRASASRARPLRRAAPPLPPAPLRRSPVGRADRLARGRRRAGADAAG